MASIRLRLHACAAVVVVSGALAVLPAGTAHALDFGGGSGLCTQDEYDVPSNLIAVDVVVIGSRGGQGQNNSSHGGGAGGRAGQVSARLAVTPGERLVVATDCLAGGPTADFLGGTGGAGSGIFSTTSPVITDRAAWHPLVVAAGGGGGGGGGSSGPGGTGGDVQSFGNNGSSNEAAAGAGGAGATATSGGAGGNGGCGNTGPGQAGQIWSDTATVDPGRGGFCGGNDSGEGGGGGGGYYGGGGGGGGDSDGGGGGGGGSDYADPSATNVVETVAGSDSDITIDPVLYTSTTTLSTGPNSWPTGVAVHYVATVHASLNPTGTVTYQAQPASGGPTISMGSAPVINGGASLADVLPPGVWSVSAGYGGDAMDLPSTATPITETIGSAPQIWANPAHADVALGATATFTATSIKGDPAPTAEWQVSFDSGATWLDDGPGTTTTDSSDDTTSTLSVLADNLIAQNGSLYRVVFSNVLGSVTSAVASLGVNGGASVLTSPTTVRAFDGNQVGLLSEAEGNPRPDATWQTSSNGGGTWTDIGAGDPTFTVTDSVDTPLVAKSVLQFQSTSALNGRQFRVRWTNTVNTTTFTVYSQIAGFTWMPLPTCIVPNPTPSNHANCHGVHFDGQFLVGLPGAYGDFSDATFVNATLVDATFGGANLSGADLSGADVTAAGFQGASLTGATLDGTNAGGAVFQDADLTGADLAGATFTGTTVSGANFTHTQALPGDVTLYEAGPVFASPVWGAPAGVTGLTTTCGYAVSDVPWSSGPNSVPCSVEASPFNDGTGTITVTLVPPAGPQVTTDPTDATTMFQPAAPYSAAFSAAGSGAPPPTVQWQVSTDHGASFSDIATATNPTLTVDNPPVSADGTQYRAVFTNSQGTATSHAATLHVQRAPIEVVVQGRQTYGQSPTFTPSIVGLPPGVTVSGTLACSAIFTPDFQATMPITTALTAGSYTVDTRTCGGLTPSDTTDYAVNYVITQAGDFTVQPVTIIVSVSGTKTIPGPVTFTEVDNAPAGILPAPFNFACATLSDGTPIASVNGDGSYTVLGSSCSGPPPIDPIDYVIAYQGAANGFTVQHAVVHVVVGGYQTYGSTSPTFTETDNTGTLGVPPLSGTLACTGVAAPTLAVGSYPLPGSDCGGLSSPILPVQYQDGQFQVLPAPLSITADDQSMVYGGSLPTFTYQATGLVNGDTPAALGITCSAPTAGATPAVGTYPIVCSNTTDSNYTLAGFSPPGTLTVKPANATVVADDTSMAYGGTTPTLTYHVTGLVNNDAQSVVSGVTCISDAPASPAADSYTITCSGGTAANYTLSHLPAILTVNRAPLTVTAHSTSMTYGGTVPALTATITGFVNGDGSGVVSGTPSCTTTATSSSAAGHYPITCGVGSLSASNYSFTFVPGTLTVGAAELTVTADNKSMMYGGPRPALTATITGFVNGDGGGVVSGQPSCSSTGTSSSPATTYAITCALGTLSASNYTFTFAPGTLTIDPAQLTVTADNKSMTYGGTRPALTATITGFVNGDGSSVVTGQASCSSTGTSSSPATTYAITCALGTLSASNYTFTFAPGTLTIDPAPLSVTAKDKSTIYGGPAPAFDATVLGLVAPDTFASLGGTCSDAGATTAAVGTHPGAITCSGITSTNYAVTYHAGTLTVTPAPLTVAADPQSMVYGGPLPTTFTYTVNGLVNGDDPSVVTGVSCGAPGVTATSAVGPYSIVCSGGTAANYTVTGHTAGTLQVTPATATVVADDKSMVYGTTVPPFTYHVDGLVNGDPATLITGVVCTSGAGTNPIALAYAITCSGGSSSSANYTVASTSGTLTVNRAPLTVIANDKSMTYGGTVPSFDATVIGMVPPDTFSGFGGTCSDLSASQVLAAGTYPGTITCRANRLILINYSVTFKPGTLTVNRAHLTVSADNKSMTYGDPVPPLTSTISGFVNGESSSVVSGAPSCTTTGTTSSPAGQYPIHCTTTTLSASNYDFLSSDGTLTIGRHGATVGYTGGMFFPTSSASSTTGNVPLQALVVPASGGSVDVTRAAVTFELFKSSTMTMNLAAPDLIGCTAPANSSGVASCTVTGLSADNWTVVPVITGGYFSGPAGDPVIMTVYQTTTDSFATGGGWVSDPSQTVSAANRHGNFGFNVHVSSTSVKGQSVFAFRGADGYDYVVKSNSWNGGGAAVGLTTASFSGKCSVIVIDPATGLAVVGLGGGNYSYRVDTTVNATKPDTYAISVYTPQGALWHQAGTTAAQLALGGGNIVVHGTKK
jgi:MBG domain (YGX type)/Pentapeptide repeats (8 copies)